MGLFDKFFGGLGKTRQKIDLEELFQDYAPDSEQFYEDLEEMLILADAGMPTAERVDYLMHRKISIYINSPGGSVTAGLGIYDTMQFITSDVATICTGMAASMGAVLLVAGAEGKRSALPHSRVMIHQPLGGVQGQASDIEIEAKEILKFKKELYTIISEHSHTPYDKVYADSDRNYWMTAEEAKAYGMIDEVLTRKK